MIKTGIKTSEFKMALVLICIYLAKQIGIWEWLPKPEDITVAQQMVEARATDWTGILAGTGGVGYIISRGIAKFKGGEDV